MIREDEMMIWDQYMNELLGRPGTILVSEMSNRDVVDRLCRIYGYATLVLNAEAEPSIEMPPIPIARLPFDARGLRTGLRRPGKAERRKMRRA